MRSEKYDVVVVGAGICGLNALFVVSDYLERGQRVALVDRRERVGGMWNDTYDYVRLHQPHPFFTAGNIKWRWDKDPSHLATKPEVIDHLSYCLEVIKARATVGDYLGWSYLEHDEADGVVRTTIERDGERVLLESDRLVKAFGFDVRPNDPLRLSSTRVRSVSPDTCDVRTGEIASSDAPVWVIGGGKTAMDAVHTLVTSHPGREVSLLAGSGTYFVRRDEIYPQRPGLRRGTRVNQFSVDLAMRYDGDNDTTLYEPALGHTMLKVTPTARSWMIGLLSDDEAQRISAGVTRSILGHLVDAVDVGDSGETGDGAELVLRDGERVPVPAGTWVLNCTGYLHTREAPYEPFCSPSGRVLSINQRSVTLGFTSLSGFMLTHLLMRDRLRDLPLYELDWQALRRVAGSDATPVMWTVLMHNYTLLVEALPPTVLMRNGFDGDAWYPPLRRQWGAASFVRTRRKQRAHYQRTLDRARERYDVRCGPLATSEPAPAGRRAARRP
ncbi:potassium transporter [Nocardioides albidus]|uniref:Potassium transporter n=1 Tax=Nocardioides albidus TaxID=1517589 RepID=A0A5C4VRH1_9ACTN|nr:FAD-dependent oxidoreductase [Nocardioides albidus]TNM38391.1 potassium transporter [Nocardioides albidus]